MLACHLQSLLLLFVFPMNSAWLPTASAHTIDQEAADKKTATYQSVRFARSLHAYLQDSPIYIQMFVRSSEWAVNARARLSLALGT